MHVHKQSGELDPLLHLLLHTRVIGVRRVYIACQTKLYYSMPAHGSARAI